MAEENKEYFKKYPFVRPNKDDFKKQLNLQNEDIEFLTKLNNTTHKKRNFYGALYGNRDLMKILDFFEFNGTGDTEGEPFKVCRLEHIFANENIVVNNNDPLNIPNNIIIFKEMLFNKYKKIIYTYDGDNSTFDFQDATQNDIDEQPLIFSNIMDIVVFFFIENISKFQTTNRTILKSEPKKKLLNALMQTSKIGYSCAYNIQPDDAWFSQLFDIIGTNNLEEAPEFFIFLRGLRGGQDNINYHKLIHILDKITDLPFDKYYIEDDFYDKKIKQYNTDKKLEFLLDEQINILKNCSKKISHQIKYNNNFYEVILSANEEENEKIKNINIELARYIYENNLDTNFRQFMTSLLYFKDDVKNFIKKTENFDNIFSYLKKDISRGGISITNPEISIYEHIMKKMSISDTALIAKNHFKSGTFGISVDEFIKTYNEKKLLFNLINPIYIHTNVSFEYVVSGNIDINNLIYIKLIPLQLYEKSVVDSLSDSQYYSFWKSLVKSTKYETDQPYILVALLRSFGVKVEVIDNNKFKMDTNFKTIIDKSLNVKNGYSEQEIDNVNKLISKLVKVTSTAGMNDQKIEYPKIKFELKEINLPDLDCLLDPKLVEFMNQSKTPFTEYKAYCDDYNNGHMDIFAAENNMIKYFNNDDLPNTYIYKFLNLKNECGGDDAEIVTKMLNILSNEEKVENIENKIRQDLEKIWPDDNSFAVYDYKEVNFPDIRQLVNTIKRCENNNILISNEAKISIKDFIKNVIINRSTLYMLASSIQTIYEFFKRVKKYGKMDKLELANYTDKSKQLLQISDNRMKKIREFEISEMKKILQCYASELGLELTPEDLTFDMTKQLSDKFSSIFSSETAVFELDFNANEPRNNNEDNNENVAIYELVYD